MKVIVAEKPSLAKNIAFSIDSNMKRKDGYYENDEYIVTYAFGHLFSLYDIEMYEMGTSLVDVKPQWKIDNLPFFPEHFKFGLVRDDGIIKQYKIIRNLINRDDVDVLINAGDSDREGEIIIRIILLYALKTKKTIKRLWMPDQTPKTIREELKLMRDDSEFDSLANEGFARTYLDWCYGINLTRAATIKAKTLLRVGRVITPIVNAIYDREMSIVNFKPRNYFVLISKEKTNGEEIELTSKIEFEKDDIDKAKILADIYNNEKAIVCDIKLENKTIPPGKLYSLSKLQGELGKKYRMSLDYSLKIVQSLYEKGYVSYPRTSSQYLAENEKNKFKEIIKNFQNLGVGIEFKNSKYIFDDSKIESHSALTPTYNIPKKSDLSEEEYKVYKTIVNRFFAVFCKEPCLVSRSGMDIKVGERESFHLTGDIVINKGWTVFEEREKKEKILPKLSVGDEININFIPVSKESKPPKRYSVETLNNFLKNPFKEYIENKESIDDSIIHDDSEDYKAIFEGLELGTEATRSGIIKHAIESEYIELKDNTYRLLSKGKFYIETLNKLNMMMPKEKTAEMGKSLRKVYRNEINVDESLIYAKEEISKMINLSKNIELPKSPVVYKVDKENVLCKCPKCGNVIAISEYGFRCSNSGCGLGFYYDNKLFASLKKKITKKIAKEIFTKGKTELTNLINKEGKSYDATLVADFTNKYITFKFVYNNKGEKDNGSIRNDKD